MDLKDWLAVVVPQYGGTLGRKRYQVIRGRLEDVWVDYLAVLTDYEADHPEESRPEHDADALITGFGYYLVAENHLGQGGE